MSGAYVLQAEQGEDLHHHAHLLSAQMAFGHENVNHYAVSQSVLLGVVSPDPSGEGAMPRYLKEEKLWGVLLGRLYDSAFLSAWRRENSEAATDLDIFARLYQNGELRASLPQMNGAFFVILWDPARGTLVAANDRFGLYPMYWSRCNGRFVLASRALCAVLAGVVDGEWDPAGVAQVLTTGDLLGGTTLVKDVAAFPQATLLLKRGVDELTWRRYWEYDYSGRHDNTSTLELAQELGRLFRQSVRRQADGVRRVGVTLSGGLDSRCIAAAAAQAGISLQTFTWGKAGCYDRRFARDVARLLGANHHDCEYEYRNFETRYEDAVRAVEGACSIFDAHMMAHLHLLESNVDLILNGYAGDILLGGSFLRRRWMSARGLDELARILFAWRVVGLPEARLGRAMPNLSSILSDAMPSQLYRRKLEGCEAASTADRVDRFFLENRQRRATSIGTVLLRYGVESAACFFDYDLVDTITGLPAKWRFEHHIYLAMMRHAFPHALNVRWQRTLLPAGAPGWMAIAGKAFLKGCRLLEQRTGWPSFASRQSPVDFGVWLRGPLRDWMAAICNEPHPSADEVLRPSFCADTWREHLAGAERSQLLGVIASIRGFATALDRARRREPSSSQTPQEVKRE